MLRLPAEEFLKVCKESLNSNITARLDKENVCKFKIFFSPHHRSIFLFHQSQELFWLYFNFFSRTPLWERWVDEKKYMWKGDDSIGWQNRLLAQGVIAGNAGENGCPGKKRQAGHFTQEQREGWKSGCCKWGLVQESKSIKHISSRVSVVKSLVQVSQISVASIEACRKICSHETIFIQPSKHKTLF